jgi:D-alanyl-lipoteichoic acid acyltransferase DltB (MBOAT superfamily)
VDVYRGTVEVQKNLLYLGLYISFFPQLVAGPIVRYSTVAYQIENRRTTLDQFSEGIRRFIVGVGKKIILANQFAVVAEKAFATDELSVAFAWLGAITYTLQIYFDFSGYSDMAIGLGKMFGFEFLENFNYPYISKTITEFWRRWHISLGTWFKDYVYFPLGGSRVATKRRLIFNLFVVWFLTGVWHGSGFKFIAWGMFYFILLVFEKLVGLPKKVDKYPVLRFFYRLCTLVFINVGWVIFAESSLGGAITHLLAMVGIGSSGLVDANAVFYLREYAGLLLLGVVLSTPMMKVLLQKYQDMLSRKGYDQLKDLSQLAYLVVFFVAVSYLAISAHNPFIYFNF